MLFQKDKDFDDKYVQDEQTELYPTVDAMFVDKGYQGLLKLLRVF